MGNRVDGGKRGPAAGKYTILRGKYGPTSHYWYLVPPAGRVLQLPTVQSSPAQFRRSPAAPWWDSGLGPTVTPSVACLGHTDQHCVREHVFQLSVSHTCSETSLNRLRSLMLLPAYQSWSHVCCDASDTLVNTRVMISLVGVLTATKVKKRKGPFAADQ